MSEILINKELQRIRAENAYLRGKIEAYEDFLKMKGFIGQKECENFGEGLEDASRD